MIIAVVDGMGGSIGNQIVLGLRQALPEETVIMALGTATMVVSFKYFLMETI